MSATVQNRKLKKKKNLTADIFSCKDYTKFYCDLVERRVTEE